MKRFGLSDAIIEQFYEGWDEFALEFPMHGDWKMESDADGTKIIVAGGGEKAGFHYQFEMVIPEYYASRALANYRLRLTNLNSDTSTRGVATAYRWNTPQDLRVGVRYVLQRLELWGVKVDDEL